MLFQCMNIPYNQQPNRNIRKHWNPKFKWLRTKKVIKVDLPNFQEKDEEVSREEQNRRLREKGVMPARQWTERPILISSVKKLSTRKTFSILIDTIMAFICFTDQHDL